MGVAWGFEEVHRIDHYMGVNPSQRAKLSSEANTEANRTIANRLEGTVLDTFRSILDTGTTGEYVEDALSGMMEDGRILGVDYTNEKTINEIIMENNETQDNTQEQLIKDAGIENMGNEELATVIEAKLGYSFAKQILVKPLPVEKVFKTLTVPTATEEMEEDEEGNKIPVMEMKETQVETESMLRKGVVISIPESLKANDNKFAGMTINLGDTIVFPNKRSMDFDLFKDSALVDAFDVIAKVA